MNWKKRDHNQIGLRQRMLLRAAGSGKLHIEDSIFRQATIRFGKHPSDVGKPETGSLPEKPAQRSVGEIAQANVGFAGRFSDSPLPTGNGHGRHTHAVAKAFLAEFASLTHILNLVRPLGNGDFGSSTHGLALQKNFRA